MTIHSLHSLGICASIVAFAADQASKAVVLANADTLAAGINVAPGFNLVFHRNTGVTFGLLQGIPWWALAMLAAAIVLFLAVSLVRATSIAEAVAYGLVIGGGLGNILDRIRFGGVTDFLDFNFGTTHWPVFNLADVFVFCGVGMLLIAARREHAPGHVAGPDIKTAPSRHQDKCLYTQAKMKFSDANNTLLSRVSYNLSLDLPQP